jgi:exodeoxyribonuclease V alpha subunit
VGRYGVKEWNSTLSSHLGIPLDRTSPGLPLLNTKNDLRTGLVNGDTGIVIEENENPMAVFKVVRQTVDVEGAGTASKEEIHRFEPTSLESVEVSFATTVHKAQGSQYETAIVVCPPHTSPLSTRELIYTAATRATTRLVIVSSPKSLSHALRTRTRRESGLARRIVAMSATRTSPG